MKIRLWLPALLLSACSIYVPPQWESVVEETVMVVPQVSQPGRHSRDWLRTGRVQLVGADGQCLFVSQEDGRTVALDECSGANDEQFVLQRDGSIRSGEKCLDVAGSQNRNGTEVIAYACNGGINQQWYRDQNRIRSRLNGKCLTSGRGRSIVSDCVQSEYQVFDWKPVRRTYISERVRLIHNGGGCLDVSGNDNRSVSVCRCHGGGNQQFSFKNDGSIGNRGKCLDVAGENRSRGAKVMMYACTGRSNQQWYTEGKNIRSRLNGMCLTARAGGMVMDECRNDASQQFSF